MPRKGEPATQPQDRRTGRFVAAERTTTTITERLTFGAHHEDDTLPPLPEPIVWATGWDRNEPGLTRHDYLAQRAGQCDQALGMLALWAQSADPGDHAPEWLIRQATVILRAGPGASPMELAFGKTA